MPEPPLKIDDRAFQRALKRIDKDSKDVAAKRAIERTGKSVVKRSQKLTPVDEGDVRASHSFTTSEDDGSPVGIITVSDPASFFVHEDLEARHDDGQAKFLRDAMRQRRRFFQKVIRDEFSKLIRKEGLG